MMPFQYHSNLYVFCTNYYSILVNAIIHLCFSDLYFSICISLVLIDICILFEMLLFICISYISLICISPAYMSLYFCVLYVFYMCLKIQIELRTASPNKPGSLLARGDRAASDTLPGEATQASFGC